MELYAQQHQFCSCLIRTIDNPYLSAQSATVSTWSSVTSPNGTEASALVDSVTYVQPNRFLKAIRVTVALPDHEMLPHIPTQANSHSGR